jgi:hypothetical protein
MLLPTTCLGARLLVNHQGRFSEVPKAQCGLDAHLRDMVTELKEVSPIRDLED